MNNSSVFCFLFFWCHKCPWNHLPPPPAFSLFIYVLEPIHGLTANIACDLALRRAPCGHLYHFYARMPFFIRFAAFWRQK